MTEFMKPNITVEQVGDNIARFVMEPLERGYGQTLGNGMRRVLLSSLDGAAATAIKIEGVQHVTQPARVWNLSFPKANARRWKRFETEQKGAF